MANIFVGFQEEKLFETTNKPLYYSRYVDDITIMFPFNRPITSGAEIYM